MAVAGDGKVPFFQKMKPDYPWFTKGDVESLPMLFLDNLSSLVGIVGAMAGALPGIWAGAGIPAEFGAAFSAMVYERVCPGIGVSLLFGNLWYGWMARKLAGYEDRNDVTALPYGINTPVGFAVAFGVMLPLGFKFGFEDGMTAEQFADKIWYAASTGCFVSGLFEALGCWIGNPIRRNMSKAAIYAPIASVGFVWLALSPLLNFGSEPIIGILPLALCFLGFFANKGKGIYGKVPAALLIILVGTVAKWLNFGKYNPSVDDMSDAVDAAADELGKNKMAPFVMLQGFPDIGMILPILLPFALQSFIETMELVEAAQAVGDHYPMVESMLVDGVGTCVGALFGSVLPTTVYIGHTRHKQVGATGGYSIANAVVYFIVMMSGMFPVIFSIVDPVSIGCVLIAVGLLITQQAFACTASRHYPALALGIIVVIYDYCRLDSSDARVQIKNMAAGGGIVASFLLTQVVSDLIDVRLERAAVFSAICCGFSLLGIMHGNNPVGPKFLTEETNELAELTFAIKHTDNDGFRFAIAYGMLVVFVGLHIGLQRLGLIPEAVMDDGSNAMAKEMVPEEATEKPKESGDFAVTL